MKTPFACRCAFRRLLRSKSSDVLMIATLTLGIASVTAIFRAADAALLHPLPFAHPHELIAVLSTPPDDISWEGRTSMGDFFDWRRQSRAFSGLAAIGPAKLVLNDGGEPEEIPAAAISTNLLQVLRAHPLLGRDFRDSEAIPGLDRVVLLGHSLWLRRFGGDPEVIGKTIHLSGEPYQVIGVLGPDLQFPGRKIDLWSPIAIDSGQLTRGRRGLEVIGRLSQGFTIDRARGEMNLVTRRLGQSYPETDAGWGATVVPLQEKYAGKLRPMIALLSAATTLLLLIAFVNVVNLLLARGITRRMEIAVRFAMGAAWPMLFMQFLVESLLLALASAALALPFAAWGICLLAATNPDVGARLGDSWLGPRDLLFAFSLGAGAGTLLALVSALQSYRLGRPDATRKTQRTRGLGRTGDLLVTAEIALALILLAASGQLLRSFANLRAVDPGFRAGNGLVVNLFLPLAKYPEPSQQAAFFADLLERTKTLPEVALAATTSALPLSKTASNFDVSFNLEESPGSTLGLEHRAGLRLVSSGYFRTMAIIMREGREFTDRDRKGAPSIAIINEVMARRFWPHESPIGKKLRLDYRGQQAVEVIGVAGSIRHFGLNLEPESEIYLSSAQFPSSFASLVVRTKGNPLSPLGRIKTCLRGLDREQAFTSSTLDEIIASSLIGQRFLTLLLTTFASMAVILALVGVYGLSAYNTSRRTAEIGIRMALGAKKANVLWDLMGRSLLLIAVGIAAGSVVAASARHLLSGFLYGVEASDGFTLGTAGMVLTISALLGSYFPAKRAAALSPLSALRSRQ